MRNGDRRSGSVCQGKYVGILSIDFYVADENDESMTRRLSTPRNVVAMCFHPSNREEQMLIY
jgi:hypothetical protein